MEVDLARNKLDCYSEFSLLSGWLDTLFLLIRYKRSNQVAGVTVTTQYDHHILKQC